jgi:hypothetical protein
MVEEYNPHWYGRSLEYAKVAYSKDDRVTNPCSEIFMETGKKEDTMNKLYEIQHERKTLYGTKLAVNSRGEWVMEVKGTGDVISVDKGFVEEVMPYTIGVQFETGKTTYHYTSEKGKYNVGDVCILDAPMGRAIVNVVSVDTKSQSATKQFTPIAKLVTE